MCYFLWTLNIGKKTEETEEVQLQKKEFIFIAPQMAYLFIQMVHKVFKDSEKKPSEGR